MDDLLAWFRVQLDADERIILKIGESAIRAQADSELWIIDDDHSHDAIRVGAGRLLAQINADRKLLALHEGQHECPPDLRSAGWPPQPCLTVQLKAVPFADRAGYLPEWAPQ